MRQGFSLPKQARLNSYNSIDPAKSYPYPILLRGLLIWLVNINFGETE